MPEWFDELAAFLRIASISADPAHAGEVREAGSWVARMIEDAGGEAELIDWRGQPLVTGMVPASAGASGHAPTVLCYGHFDVQPPDPIHLWESAPFDPEIREGQIYARGVADDKGQLYMLLAAARELSRAGSLPVNVRFACDGEEETGGNSIVEYVQEDRGPADAAVIFDSEMVRRGLPAFNVATRGLVYFHVELRSGERDLHSGIFGGGALNAASALIRTLEAVLARDGTLAEPLREGIVAPTDEELASWRELPSGADVIAEQGARPADARAAEEFYRRTFAEPALDVNGFQSGSPQLVKTVLPVAAEANVSVRLAAGQDPGRIAEAFERLVREAAPAEADLTIELRSTARAAIVSPRAPAIELGLRAFERAVGTRPALIRTGGTLPIMAALADRGVPTILSGFALPDANIHSPNERLPADHVPLGIAAARALFEELAGLGPAA
jgi:acetylornithine deacetylase/succinyl-diaminopimelate desuccinylase-like protein